MKRRDKAQPKLYTSDKEDKIVKIEININSEIVVKDIIEKIISLTITESNNNYIESRIPGKCWDFLHKMLNESMKIEYMAIEKDDINVEFDFSTQKRDSTNDRKSSSTIGDNKNIKFSEFNWINPPEQDEMIKFNGSEKIKDFYFPNEYIDSNNNLLNSNLNNPSEISDSLGSFFFDNKYYGVNNWNTIDQPKSSKIDRSASNVVKVVKLNNPKNSFQIKEDIKIEQETNETKSNISKTFNRTGTIFRMTLNQMNVNAPKKKQSPIDQFPNFSLDSSNQNKQVEEDKNLEEFRRIKKEEFKKREEEVKVKQKVEKESKEKDTEVIKKHKEFERKNVTADASGSIIFIKAATADKLKNDFINPKSEVKTKADIVTKTEKGTESTLENIRKKDTTKDLKFGNFSNKKLDYNSNGFLYPILNSSYERYDKISITPAGSSFNYIMPEIGVTVIEGGLSKFGGDGKDYFKAYKKYSKYDYQTLVKDSSSLRDLNVESVGNDMYKSDRKGSLPKVITPKVESVNKVSTQNGSSNFKTKYGGSLRDALDGLDQIVESDENVTLDMNENIFKNFKKEGMDKEEYLHSLEEINKFNFSIVKNSQWGTATLKGIPNRHDSTHYKPDLREIEREVGKNIAKTKLPRSRLYSYVKAPPSMNATSSSFNKTGKSFRKANETKTSNFNKTAGPDQKFMQTYNEIIPISNFKK